MEQRAVCDRPLILGSGVVQERVDLTVISFAWDFNPEGNVRHLADHGVSIENVNAFHANDPLFFRNVLGRAASHVMVGRDNRGQSLYVTLKVTAQPGV
jgi:hypothetical protein